MTKKRIKKQLRKVTKQKLAVVIVFILLAFAGLSLKLYTITRDNQVNYQRKILSQQSYDSITLPYKRGTITDANGTILAVSEKVYNVILDCKVMLDDEKNQEPTITALVDCFGLDRTELNKYVQENPNSQYYVLKKRLEYKEIEPFLDRKKQYNEEVNSYNSTVSKDEKMGIISGVWFEDEYIRKYPNGTLACDVIGFTGTDNNGTYGLEEYYNDELNGRNGREYGYLNEDAILERTIVPATDGNSLVTTIDANIQAIVEKYLDKFNTEYQNKEREGLGAFDTGCIVMNPKNGEILAMASYPNFDLNNPKDLSKYYSEEQIAQMLEDETYYDTLNALWRNFCISDTYEPGSTAKALTLATGVETGAIVGNEVYECPGFHVVSDRTIRCNVRSGHGALDVSGALEQSCNVAFMKMGDAIGVKRLIEFEKIFNIGLKTNIDLAGEARTASLVFTENSMGPTELATASFGQGFNVTMIEMAAAFSSVVNGGYYYEPHVVSKIVNSEGDIIRNIEPRLLKQTISSSTSAQMREYLHAVVAEGTGKTARPAGYAIGGKTGTAEKVPRDHQHYVVSFIGFAPVDDPQVVIYVVVNEPNAIGQAQAHSTFATKIVRDVLTEVLPYMHVPITEEMTIAEQEELDNLLGGAVQNPEEQENQGDNPDENNSEGESGDNEGAINNSPIYGVDPETGELVDLVTGEPAEMDYGVGEETDNPEGEDQKPKEEQKNEEVKQEN